MAKIHLDGRIRPNQKILDFLSTYSTRISSLFLKLFIPTKVIEDLSWADFGRFGYHRELSFLEILILSEKVQLISDLPVLYFSSLRILLLVSTGWKFSSEKYNFKMFWPRKKTVLKMSNNRLWLSAQILSPSKLQPKGLALLNSSSVLSLHKNVKI